MTKRAWWFSIVVSICACGCEVEPAAPSDSVQVPWQFTIEFALEDYGDEGEYIARARLYDALDSLDPIGNAGKSLRLSEGDEVHAEGVYLDIETRTRWADRESFDYSGAVTDALEDYQFEFRRPDETIEAVVPSPPILAAADIGELEYRPGSTTLEWTPIEDERWVSELHPNHDTARKTAVNISIEVLDDGCLSLLDGDPVLGLAGAQNLLDRGSFIANLGVYHSPDRDCSYDIIFERVSVKTVPGTWTRDGLEVPTGGAYAFARATARRRFVALQR